MKRSRYLLTTQKETPKEAVVISHILMLRTGMIKQLTAGIYSYMPLALRSLRKIETIVREELDNRDCQELLMPMVQPASLWEESGRWQNYGKELLRFGDRKENPYCLGPTHEEVITDIVRREVRSYKDLPINLYQIQSKFRDEIRPRFGLMRGREFIMKDAYSFDIDDERSTQEYWRMYEAYKAIFTRCGLDFRPVEADSGAIGGSYTHEFHVLAQSGEDLILSCDSCEYAANSERCEIAAPEIADAADGAPEEVETPGKKTIDDLSAFLGVKPSDCIKTLVFRADDKVVGCMIPGDRELNEIALKNVTGAIELEMVTDAETFAQYGLCPGYLGPLNWPAELPLYLDDQVAAMASGVAGANKVDYHFKNVVPARDIKATKTLTLRTAKADDACPRCHNGKFREFRGIEVGQVFKLGTKYSQSMGATYLDTDGKEQAIVMGCYGIGISRTMASAIEQNHDKDGIIWPVQIAPFHVMLLNLDINDDTVNQAVDSLFQGLRQKGVEVLIDDLPNRPGPKFKDADLIGLPVQLTVGARSLKNGNVELKTRRDGQKKAVPLAAAVDEVVTTLISLGWKAP